MADPEQAAMQAQEPAAGPRGGQGAARLSPVQEYRIRQKSPVAEYRRKQAERRREQRAAQRQAPSHAVGVPRAFAQGVTFAFADEIEAGARALFDQREGEDFETAYRRIRDGVRQSNANFARENPITAAAAEIGGAVLVPGLGTAAAAGRAIGTGARLAPTLARAGAVGAAEGAAYGTGTAEEMSDIPASAAVGAATGAVLGAGVAGAFRGGRAAYDAVRNPQNAANRRIMQAIERDGLDAATVQRELRLARASGKPATLADVGGENVKRELERVAQSPGAGADMAAKFLTSRNKEQLSRVSRDLVSMTGTKGEDVAEVISRTMRQRARAAAPVYDRAMQFQAELNDDIVEAYSSLIASPLGKQAMSKARRILNVEDFDGAPLMDRIDAVKRGMDDLVGQAMRSGEKQIARKAIDAKDSLIKMVDAANPEYSKAREIWGDGARYLDSINEGRGILSNKFTASEARRVYRELPEVDREAFRIGAVDAIITKMRQQSAEQPNLIRILRSPDMQDKIQAILSPKMARRFKRMIDMEDRMFRVSSDALGNSRTAQRRAAQEEAEKQLRALEAVGILLDSVTMGARQMIIRGMTWAPRRAREALMARQNEIIAGQLISRDPRIIRMLQEADSLGRSGGNSARSGGISSQNQAGNGKTNLSVSTGSRPKPVTERPFTDDYPKRGSGTPAEGDLGFDIEGRPLSAPVIAGRRRFGGNDEGLTAKAIGETAGEVADDVRTIPRSAISRRADGAFSRRAGKDGPERIIELAQGLKEHKLPDTLAHEAAHAIDDIAGLIPVKGLKKQFSQVYSDLNGGRQGSTKRQMTPEANGYKKGDDADRELIAESLRAYMIDPNYLKSVAPDVAKRIREWVNANATLKHVIQFNSVAAAVAVGAASGAREGET